MSKQFLAGFVFVIGWAVLAPASWMGSARAQAPSAPTCSAAFGGVNQVCVDWNAPTGSTASTIYYVFRASASANLASLTPATITVAVTGGVGSVTNNVTYLGSTATAGTFFDTTAVNGTTYYYAVAAANAASNSASTSSPSTATVTVPVPGYPSTTALTVGTSVTGVSLSSSSYVGCGTVNGMAAGKPNGNSWGGHQQAWYTVNLSAGNSCSMSVSGTNTMVMGVLNSSGTELYIYQTGNPATITFIVSQTGTYTVIASRNTNNPSAASLTYGVKVTSAAPATATGLTAVASSNAVTLTWQASASGTNTNTRYYVFSAAASASLSSLTASTATTAIAAGVGGVTNNVTYLGATGTAGAVTFVDTTGVNGTTYYYTVIASNSPVDSGSTSGPATTVSGTPGGLTPPGTPGTPVATPTDGQVSLSWSASTATTSATLYYIFRAAASASLTSLTPATVTTTIAAGVGGTSNNVTYIGATTVAGTLTYLDTTVANGSTYYYVVAASNSPTSSAVTSGPSGTVSAALVGLGVPGTPVATIASSQVSLSWSASTGTNSGTLYYVFRAAASASLTSLTPATVTTTIAGGVGGVTNNVTYVGVTSAAGVLTFVDNTVTNGSTYYYVVASSNSPTSSALASSPSGTVSATPLGLSAPATVTAYPGDGQTYLTWNTAATGTTASTQYYVFRTAASASANLASMTPATVTTTIAAGVGGVVNSITYVGSSTGTTLPDTTVTDGTTYYYAVASSNSPTSTTNTAAPTLTVSVTPAPVSTTPLAVGVLTNGSLMPNPGGSYNGCGTVGGLAVGAGQINGGSWAGHEQTWYTVTLSKGNSCTITMAASNTVVLSVQNTAGTQLYFNQQITPATLSFVVNSTATYIVIASRNSNGASATETYTIIVTCSPPNAVSNLNATTGSNQVSLSWSAASGSNANTLYYVFRSPTSTGLSSLTGTTATTAIAGGVGSVSNNVTYLGSTGTAGVVSFTDMTAVNGAGYYYAIVSSNSAVDSGSTSGPSNISSVGPVPPSAASSLTIVGGESQATLSWTAATTGTNSTTLYYVFRALDPNSPANLTSASATSAIAAGVGAVTGSVTYVGATGTAGTTTFVDNTVSDGISYYYTVVTSNSATSSVTTSTPSAVASVTPGPVAPSNVTLYPGDGQMYLNWSAAASGTTANTRYYLFRATDSSLSTLTPATATAAIAAGIGSVTNNITYVGATGTAGVVVLFDTTVTDGITYNYSVVTSNSPTASGPTSAPSTPVSGTPAPVPTTPLSVGVSTTGTLAPNPGGSYNGCGTVGGLAVGMPNGNSWAGHEQVWYTVNLIGGNGCTITMSASNTVVLSVQNMAGTQLYFNQQMTPASLSFTVPATATYVVIASRNSNGASAAENFTIIVNQTPPGAVTSLKAVGGAGQNSLSWAAASSSSAFTLYYVFSATASANLSGLTAATATIGIAAGIQAVTNGVTYLGATGSAGVLSFVDNTAAYSATTYYAVVSSNSPTSSVSTSGPSNVASATPTGPGITSLGSVVPGSGIGVTQTGALSSICYQGNSASTSLSAPSGGAWIPQGTYQNWYSVNLTGGSAYVISMQTTGNSFLSVQDSNGNQVAWNDDANVSWLGSTLASQVIFTPGSTGTYTIICSTESPTTTLGYTLTIPNPSTMPTSIGTLPYTSSGTALSSTSYFGAAAATSMGSPGGNSWANYQQDWYSVAVTASDTYAFTMNLPGGTAVLSLQDSGGNQVAYSSSASTAQIIYTPGASGTYTIICSQAAVTNATTPYTLTIPAPSLPVGTVVNILAPSILTPNNGIVTVTVVPQSGSATPVGTVTLNVANGPAMMQTLNNGSATFTITSPAFGSYVLNASYSGAVGFQPSTGSGNLSVGVPNVQLAPRSPAIPEIGGLTAPAAAAVADGHGRSRETSHASAVESCSTMRHSENEARCGRAFHDWQRALLQNHGKP